VSKDKQIERRSFIRNIAAGTAAAAAWKGSAMGKSSPNDVIGVACVAVGTQGHRLLQQAQAVPKTEIRVICDLYDGNIKRAQGLTENSKVKLVKEWEKAVSDPDVDVVIVASPDFWHAPMTVAAAQNKKDVYVEKALCVNLDEAKQMRTAVKENDVVLQLGHHYRSLPTFHKAREIFRSGALGKTPLVRGYIDRTNSYPEWRFFTDYQITEMPKDASPATIDWDRFQANAPNKRAFDPVRFFNWRCYWDYGTGIAGDLLSHIWDSVNMVMEMGIPESASTQGGLYFWQDGREVPDMWHVLYDYPKQDLAVTFACSFHNRRVGEVVQYLGRDVTMEVSPEFCKTFGAEWKPDYLEKLMQARDAAAEVRQRARQAGLRPLEPTVPPDYSFQEGELKVTSHMEDFLESVRTRKQPRCHIDAAFEEMVAVAMSVESYRQERKVRWDPEKEEII
jgi:predicted dehydrogenase